MATRRRGRAGACRSLSRIAILAALLATSPAGAQKTRKAPWLALIEHMAGIVPDQIPHPPGDPIYAYPAIGAPQDDRSLRVLGNQFMISFLDTGETEGARRIAACFKETAAVADRIPGRPIFLLRVTGGARQLLQVYRSGCLTPAGEEVTVEPNLEVKLLSNQQGLDPTGPMPWYYRNNGEPGGVVDADVDGAEALSRFLNERRPPENPLRPTIVAMIDSGIDVTHPALAPSLWVNSGEIAGNGVDDDGNGYRDDVHGWNFAGGNNILTDTHRHGTHVAGIIAARPLPGRPVRGIAPATAVLTARITFDQPDSSGFLVAKAIYYAISAKVDVINMSFGGPTPSDIWNRALDEADQSGIILVAAAGNDGRDLRVTPIYPCLYGPVFCVVATDRTDRRAAFSNWSDSLSLIAAPGVDIYSTLPGGGYGPLSGTSMAAPLVAGTIAGIKSLWPDLSGLAAMSRLTTSTDSPPGIKHVGRINAYRAYYGAAQRYGPADGYCNEQVQLPNNGGLVRRYQNYPYANSDDPGVDGMSLATPFTICTARQLLSIAETDLEKIFVLRTHIDFAQQSWTTTDQIGAYVESGGAYSRPFNGIIDGNGFEIRDYASLNRPSAGLIAELGVRGFVTNMRFTRAQISARQNSVLGSAGIVAAVSAGRLYNIQAEGSVAGYIRVGGLVGRMSDGSIGASFFEGQVKGAGQVGGLVGSGSGASRIADSFFQGRIAGTVAGGIAGEMHSGRIDRSYAYVHNDAVAGTATVGGLVGALMCRGRIENSYAEGSLSGDKEIGGLVGRLMDADMANSYASVPVSGTTLSGGAAGFKHDGLGAQIDPDAPKIYYCSGTGQKPPPSSVRAVFYNSTLTSQGGAEGKARSSAELRTAATFPGWDMTTWRFSQDFMPALSYLPRTQSSAY